MKVWIITSKFGQGHYSAARALQEELLEEGHEVVVTDVMELLYPKMYKNIYYLFNHVICRNSTLYNFLNEFGRTSKQKKTPYVSQGIDDAIKEINPDIIVTTWSACAKLVTGYDIPIYVCITDTGIHKGWIEKRAKGYLVATEHVKKKLLYLGIESEKIHVFGIPVGKVFKETYKKVDGSPKILIMGGGLGILPWIEETLDELGSHLDVSVTVITGHNKKLYNRLRNKYPQVTVMGFTDEVYRHLRDADLLVSKPGGVSLFEAIYTETPCIAVFPEYKHEIENAQFIHKYEIGEVVWEGESVGDHIVHLARNQYKQKEYGRNMMKIKKEIELEKQKKPWKGYEDAV